MTTRAIVPNGDGEGSLGTSTVKWGAVYSSDPASGENSGQVPTTAWVQKLLADALAKQKTAYEQAISTAVSAAQTKAKLDAHPVGSYYWSNDNTSPATLFGGTWESLPAGYTLIAQGSGSDSFGSFTYTAGQKYGERKHQLTTDEMARHNHGQNTNGNGKDAWNESYGPMVTRSATNGSVVGYSVYAGGYGWTTNQNQVMTAQNGGNVPHNNLPPSIAAYCWKRTA